MRIKFTLLFALIASIELVHGSPFFATRLDCSTNGSDVVVAIDATIKSGDDGWSNYDKKGNDRNGNSNAATFLQKILNKIHRIFIGWITTLPKLRSSYGRYNDGEHGCRGNKTWPNDHDSWKDHGESNEKDSKENQRHKHKTDDDGKGHGKDYGKDKRKDQSKEKRSRENLGPKHKTDDDGKDYGKDKRKDQSKEKRSRENLGQKHNTDDFSEYIVDKQGGSGNKKFSKNDDFVSQGKDYGKEDNKKNNGKEENKKNNGKGKT